MVREHFLTIRVNAEERAMVARIARRLERTPSDVVRLVFRDAAREMVRTGRRSDGEPLTTAQVTELAALLECVEAGRAARYAGRR